MIKPVLAVDAAPTPDTGHLDALVHAGYPVIEAEDLDAALDMARRTLPRMVLIDASAAREAPLHLVLHLRGQVETRHIPVLVLRAGRPLAGEDVLCGLGGVSCLPHPFQLRWLLQEVQYLTTRSAAGTVIRRTRRKETVLFEMEAGMPADRPATDSGRGAPLPVWRPPNLPAPVAV